MMIASSTIQCHALDVEYGEVLPGTALGGEQRRDHAAGSGIDGMW